MNRRAWEVRPLLPAQVTYAAVDVAYMHRLAELLHDPLPPKLRAIVLEHSAKRVAWYDETDEVALHDGSSKAIAPVF